MAPDVPTQAMTPAEALTRMRLIRRFEERVLELQRSGEITGSVHLCIGQEAIPVGACSALQSDDPVIATYRGHGWALAKGAEPAQMFAEMMGRESQLNGGRGGSAYLSAPQVGFLGENSIVGAGMPMAVGVALSCSRQGQGRVPLAVIGDGAMNQGNVHESLNMAAVLGWALVVVVENNGYAEMTPSDDLTAVPAADRASAYGIAGHRVDGNDPFAVADAVAAARRDAVAASKPVLVEAMTHRLGGHYSGDLQAYRPAGELEAAAEREPLVRLGAQLDGAEVAAVEADVEARLDEALAVARNLPAPQIEGALDHVYA